MSAIRLEGKKIADRLLDEARAMAGTLPRPAGFAAILVGDDAASHIYVALKEKACKHIGVRFELHAFPADVPSTILVETIEALNRRDDIDAILVQLPLPAHIDSDAIVAAIDPSKDVDGFHPVNAKMIASGRPRTLPPLSFGIGELIEAAGIALKGKHAVCVAKNDIFYAPLAHVLMDLGLKVRRIAPGDASINELAEADVIVVAVGEPGFLHPNMVKQGAIVIDVGVNRVDGKIVGDVDPEVREKAAFISPVPGGVGPVTVAAVARNAVILSSARQA